MKRIFLIPRNQFVQAPVASSGCAFKFRGQADVMMRALLPDCLQHADFHEAFAI